MNKVLICGVVIQLVTAIFDIIVDYIQVCTLKTKETLGKLDEKFFFLLKTIFS